MLWEIFRTEIYQGTIEWSSSPNIEEVTERVLSSVSDSESFFFLHTLLSGIWKRYLDVQALPSISPCFFLSLLLLLLSSSPVSVGRYWFLKVRIVRGSKPASLKNDRILYTGRSEKSGTSPGPTRSCRPNIECRNVARGLHSDNKC